MKLRGSVAAANCGAKMCGVMGGDLECRVQRRIRDVVRRFQRVVNLAGEILRECDGGQPVEVRAFPAPAIVPLAMMNPSEAFSPTLIPLMTGSQRAGKQMTHRNVDAVARRAVDNPGRTAEAAIGGRRVDRTIAGFCRAHPTLLTFRCDDIQLMAAGTERVHQFVEKHALDTVVICDQETHAGRRKL